jgi:C-type lysozyme/alpha-lactalbumin family
VSAAKLLGALALTSLFSIVTAGCAAEAGEDEEVGESEDRLLAGRRLSPSEIAGHLRAAGFPENQIGRMVCTAKYESSYYERASNKNTNGSMDRGLFQINSIHLGSMPGCPSKSNVNALWSAETNAKCAYAIFKAQGNKAWYGYRKHKTECDSFPAPSSGGFTPSTNDDTDAADTSNDNSTPDDGSEGGCWSGTLQDMVDARTCVQSRSNNVWFQCMEGAWYRGGDAQSGPFGPCQGSHAL